MAGLVGRVGEAGGVRAIGMVGAGRLAGSVDWLMSVEVGLIRLERQAGPADWLAPVEVGMIGTASLTGSDSRSEPIRPVWVQVGPTSEPERVGKIHAVGLAGPAVSDGAPEPVRAVRTGA
jgi:hypothetical protein